MKTLRELLFPVTIVLLMITSVLSGWFAFNDGKVNLEMIFFSIQGLLLIIVMCAIKIASNSERK